MVIVMLERLKTAQPADGAFAHAVGELYRLAIRTRPWDGGGVSIRAAINALQLGGALATLSAEDQLQVRVVVIGLVTIDYALELVYEKETNRRSGELEGRPTAPPVELLCASQLLNALVRRSSDPAWRYISAIRSASLGGEAIPADQDTNWRRNFFAGFRASATMGRRAGRHRHHARRGDRTGRRSVRIYRSALYAPFAAGLDTPRRSDCGGDVGGLHLRSRRGFKGWRIPFRARHEHRTEALVGSSRTP
jgi:hypothetical protein